MHYWKANFFVIVNNGKLVKGILQPQLCRKKLTHHGLWPARLPCPRDSPRILEWVSHFILQGIFLTQGSNLRLLWLLHCLADSLPPAKSTRCWGPFFTHVCWWWEGHWLESGFPVYSSGFLLFSRSDLNRNLNHPRLQWFYTHITGRGLQLSFFPKIWQFFKHWMMATEAHGWERAVSGNRAMHSQLPLKSSCGSQMNIWAVHASLSPWPPWREATGR